MNFKDRARAPVREDSPMCLKMTREMEPRAAASNQSWRARSFALADAHPSGSMRGILATLIELPRSESSTNIRVYDCTVSQLAERSSTRWSLDVDKPLVTGKWAAERDFRQFDRSRRRSEHRSPNDRSWLFRLFCLAGRSFRYVRIVRPIDREARSTRRHPPHRSRHGRFARHSGRVSAKPEIGEAPASRRKESKWHAFFRLCCWSPLPRWDVRE